MKVSKHEIEKVFSSEGEIQYFASKITSFPQSKTRKYIVKSLSILIIPIVLCMMSITASSQIPFMAFKANEGVSTAKKSAESSIASAKLIGIVTLGDTTSQIQIPLDITFFNYTNGTSQGWVYIYRGKVKNSTKDTVITVPVAAANVLGAPFFQVIPVDLGLGSLAGFYSKDSVIPTKFISSDVMIKNIKANADYKIFAAANPDSKPFLVPLGYYPSAILFPRNSLIWELSFPAKNGAMVCEVHGITGETKCQSFTGVEEQTQTSSFAITPNPAKNQATLTIPNELFAPNVSVELFNALGTSLQRFSVSINITEKITIPLDGLADGVYFVRYTANGRNYTKSLVIQN